MPPTPKLELEDGSRITDERQATERWLRFASERHVGQTTSAIALLETIAHARSIFAATVRQELFPARAWIIIPHTICQGPVAGRKSCILSEERYSESLV